MTSTGFAVAVGLAIGVSFIIGLLTYFVVQGEAENYFVAGHSLPLWIVAMTLGAQSVDSNALLGNVDLSYKFHFFDGAAIPIGLGISLILNGLFLASHINKETALTLPDVLAKRYGKTVEVLISLTTICSFLMLLAGNLVGMGVITSYVWGINEKVGIWLAAAIVWACKFVITVVVDSILTSISGRHGQWRIVLRRLHGCDPGSHWLDRLHRRRILVYCQRRRSPST